MSYIPLKVSDLIEYLQSLPQDTNVIDVNGYMLPKDELRYIFEYNGFDKTVELPFSSV